MSYEEYYQLQEQPFANVIENRFFYNSAQHADALLRLRYAIDTMKGLAVLLGDIGTGKTTIARKMLDDLEEDHYESALLVIIHGEITIEWLLRKIAMQFGVEEYQGPKVDLLGRLYERLVGFNEQGKRSVVLIDEAQMLRSRDVMEELRGLLNLEIHGAKLITFILFGLPELDDSLSLDEPLKQRIALKYRLRAFNDETTREYILHRLKIAGGDPDLFTPEALETIHHASRGVPRLINTICDNALLEGFLTRREQIEQDVIQDVAADLGLNSAGPTRG